MNPIFKEYIDFLNDKTKCFLPLQEGYFWLDKSIIKCFDKKGQIHKLYRICVDNDLNIKIKVPKTGYDKIEDINIASWQELVEINEKHLYQIEKKSLNIIKKKLRKYNDYIPIVPVSMGKDSMVTCHLIRTIRPDTHAIFNNTTLDCADTYIMAKKFNNCEIMTPKKGFYQYVDSDHMIPTRFSRFCCRIFKVGEMVNQLDHNTKYLFFMGMRNEESSTRSEYKDEWINVTEWGKTEWQGILPIRKWSELDVWLYTFWKNLDINPKYKKGYSRVGCHVACPFYSKSTWVLDKYWFPRAYERWHKILEDDFINEGKWNILNCTIKEYHNSWNGGVVRDEPTEEVIDEFMQYKGIDKKEIAEKYFNNRCSCCNEKLKKNDVGLSLKYFGRETTKLLCMKCIEKEFGISKKTMKKNIEMYKHQGCSLF